MNLLKRLKNLWDLSEFEPSSIEKEKIKNMGDMFVPLLKRKMAQVVEMPEEIDLDD